MTIDKIYKFKIKIGSYYQIYIYILWLKKYNPVCPTKSIPRTLFSAYITLNLSEFRIMFETCWWDCIYFLMSLPLVVIIFSEMPWSCSDGPVAHLASGVCVYGATQPDYFYPTISDNIIPPKAVLHRMPLPHSQRKRKKTPSICLLSIIQNWVQKLVSRQFWIILCLFPPFPNTSLV